MYSYIMGEHTVYATKKKFQRVEYMYVARAAKSHDSGGRLPILKRHCRLILLDSRLLAHLGFSLRLDILSVEDSVWVVFFNGLPTFYDF